MRFKATSPPSISPYNCPAIPQADLAGMGGGAEIAHHCPTVGEKAHIWPSPLFAMYNLHESRPKPGWRSPGIKRISAKLLFHKVWNFRQANLTDLLISVNIFCCCRF